MCHISRWQADSTMKRRHSHLFHLLDLLLIAAYVIYVLLDAFVIPRKYATVTADEEETSSTADTVATQAKITASSYQDDNISITITESTVDGSQVYVADVVISDISYLKTALAENSYGRNITAKTSQIAESVNAILATNGDYYGARNSGYVIRNGTVYRTSSASSS